MKRLFEKMFKKDVQLKYIFNAYQPRDKTLFKSDTRITEYDLDKPKKRPDVN
jgi:hypothetical protein